MMEVILLEKVKNLGDLGDRVNVRGGYGRNFLLPQGKALRASRANIEVFEQRRNELEKEAADSLATAQKRADKLREATVKVAARVSPEGKLYGSVGPGDVAEALSAGGYEVAKSEVQLSLGSGVIRETGEFEAVVHLHADVEVPIKVVVEGAA